MATLAHALQLLGFIPPLVIFLIRRQSRFVSFHALQSLLWCLAYLAVIFVVMFGGMLILFVTIATHIATKDAAPPLGLFAFLPLIWLVLIAGNIISIVLAIMYAIKAGNGEWADYPIFGKLARRILKMGPV